MKRNDVDVDKAFIDMGLDSIVGVEWIQTINKQYGLTMSAAKLYDYPTIRELARFLKGETERQVSSHPTPSVSSMFRIMIYASTAMIVTAVLNRMEKSLFSIRLVRKIIYV